MEIHHASAMLGHVLSAIWLWLLLTNVKLLRPELFPPNQTYNTVTDFQYVSISSGKIMLCGAKRLETKKDVELLKCQIIWALNTIWKNNWLRQGRQSSFNLFLVGLLPFYDVCFKQKIPLLSTRTICFDYRSLSVKSVCFSSDMSCPVFHFSTAW